MKEDPRKKTPMKFHLTKKGVPAKCGATVKACPLGGDENHFDSAEDAEAYSMKRQMEADLAAFEADHLTDEGMDEQSDLLTDEGWDAFMNDLEEDRAADLEEKKEGWRQASDSEALDEDFDDLAFEALDELEREELDYDAYLASLPPMTEEEEATYDSWEEEALASVSEHVKAQWDEVPLEWMTALQDSEASERAARDFSTYKGRLELASMATAVANEARALHAEGKLTDNELRAELDAVSALQFVVGPKEGRRREGLERQVQPLDPEVIKNLQCLSMKRLGSDPLDPQMIEALKLKFLKKFKQPFDESGYSIPDLLKMAREGKLD